MKTMHSVFARSILLLGLLSGCFPEQPPSDNAGAGGAATHPHPQTGGGKAAATGDGDTTPTAEPDAGTTVADYVETRGLVETCTPAKAALALPQRDGVTSDSEQTAEVRISVDDLWTSFNKHCGHCHVDAANGGYQVNRQTFATLVTQGTVDTFIEATDPNIAMPRGPEGADDDHGIDFSKRPDTDPIRALANTLSLWIKAGSPGDVFSIPNPDLGTQSVFLMTPEVAGGMTNIGSCVPSNDFTMGWGADRHQKMKDLDTLFANLQRKPRQDGMDVSPPDQLGLPLHLSDTDLFTFDTQELARYGVIAFAPAYPLWSDGSGKLRYVRVPLGQSIQFNKDTKEFTIPPNTRFYKTFMKQVIDRGSQAPRYRKIETRLIVSRPDNAPGDPGALFGTYVWNEDETEATLLGVDNKTGEAQLQRDLTPFPDVITSYYTDEVMADALLDPPPASETYTLENTRAASGEPVLRHYLLPGKERCRECHMGSVRGDFVLGFTPMQISRRPINEGGVIEETGPDELTQLDRLSALGVITGLSSAADIPHLEESEGTRQPRNNHELIAQGYMFGNCAHCHNPGGYATNSVPELGPLLNFWPSTTTGGIFQFPLARTSTRTTRGAEGRAVPYITPSLYDMLPFGYLPTETNRGTVATADYIPKFFTNISDDGSPVFDLAPWRSLIYRNTQTPFTYGDDLTIFPHMPLNTSGYDCRVSQILGTWMVSIPAQLKPGGPPEDYVGDNPSSPTPANVFPGDPAINNDPQPYVEVSRYDPGYSDALAAATNRVLQFQNGMRYGACPSNADVIDVPLVGDTANQIPPDSADPLDGVPDQTNFVATDLTEAPGAWQPRGNTWKQVLVDHVFATPPAGGPELDTYNQIRAVVSDLTDNGGVVFDKKLDDFVSTPIPFAPWKPNPKCDFSQPVFANTQAQTYDNINKPRPRWLDLAQVPATTPIMEKLPGGNIFDMICINCHGPNMDSKGRQADTVQQITGGASRVANFLNGLFGPPASPGTNRATAFAFADAIGSSATADDWGARYMSWMALGGTTAKIPRLVLDLVGRSVVAGTSRRTALVEKGGVSANMLESARIACRRLFFASGAGIEVDLQPGNLFGVDRQYPFYPLIQTNGDAELWEHLCSINNPPIIRGINVDKTGGAHFGSGAFYLSTAYPANTPVGNQRGESVMSGPNGGVTDENYVPWCVVLPTPGTDDNSVAIKRAFDAWMQAHPTSNGQPPPTCPTSLVQATSDQIDAFASRGAINAGFAVFRYIDLFSRGKASKARFDECTLAIPSP